METKYLFEFVALAETGNYWQTADNLFISQSSLSKHIMTLERELGVTLFDRTTRQVRLSLEGECFLPYAVKVTQLLEEYHATAESRKKVGSHVVSIASTSQMTHYRTITDALAQYKRHHLDCRLDIIIEPHKNLKNLLLQHKVDFIWIGESEDEFRDTNVSRLPFLVEPMVAVFSKRHPLARRSDIPLSALEGQDIIIQDNSSIEQSVFLDFCQCRHFQARITSLPGGSIPDFVRSDLGVAIMLKSVAQELGTADLSIVELEESPLIRVNLLYLTHRSLPEAAKSFLKFLEQWQRDSFK